MKISYLYQYLVCKKNLSLISIFWTCKRNTIVTYSQFRWLIHNERLPREQVDTVVLLIIWATNCFYLPRTYEHIMIPSLLNCIYRKLITRKLQNTIQDINVCKFNVIVEQFIVNIVWPCCEWHYRTHVIYRCAAVTKGLAFERPKKIKGLQIRDNV